MSQQETLFELHGQETVAQASARRSDPPSSHAAAERMNKSGEAKRQREHAVDLVYLHPGKTSKELAELTEELDRFQLARRLPEAAKAGLIEQRKEGRRECTWWPRD